MKILIIFIFISLNSIYANELCLNENSSTCQKSMNYIESLKYNKYGLSKIESVSYLGAYSSTDDFFSKNGINKISKKLSNIKTYKSALFEEEFYAIAFQKVENYIYIVEAYFKDNNIHFTGFNSKRIPLTSFLDSNGLNINDVSFDIDSNSLPLYERIFKKTKKEKLENALNNKLRTKPVSIKNQDIEAKEIINIHQVCIKNGKELNIRDKNSKSVKRASSNDIIYVLSNKTFASTYMGKDKKIHNFYVYEIVKFNNQDVNYYVTSGKYHYQECTQKRKELSDDSIYKVY